MTQLYAYPTPNAQLIQDHSLQAHPEGGFFVQTDIIENEVPSPYADGQPRMLATQIYYLITPESPRGRMHMNKSATFHLHHCGRALYTLVKPPTDSATKPQIKHVVMGANHAAGEVKQLFVDGGWWKASEVPLEDLKSGDKETTGCLISEVVVPGFHWTDHKFLDTKGLIELYGGDAEAEGVKKLTRYVKAIEVAA